LRLNPCLARSVSIVQHEGLRHAQRISATVTRLSRCITSRLANLVAFAGWTGDFLIASHFRFVWASWLFSATNFNLIYRFDPLPLLLMLAGVISFVKILQIKYLNNLVEQDHRFIKKNHKADNGL